jgi:hypothetical protein
VTGGAGQGIVLDLGEIKSAIAGPRDSACNSLDPGLEKGNDRPVTAW